MSSAGKVRISGLDNAVTGPDEASEPVKAHLKYL